MSNLVAMQQMIAMDGTYPSTGSGDPAFRLGMIQTYAGTSPVFGAPLAQGQPYSQSDPIYPVIGNAYGDNGPGGALVLPDLDGLVAVGGGFGEATDTSLAMTYLIASGSVKLDGLSPAPLTGMVMPFAGDYAPEGWLIADGSFLKVSEYGELFSMIGTLYGSDSGDNFALPQLNGAAVVGAGGTLKVGDKVTGGPVPGVAMNYLICYNAEEPTDSGEGAFPATQSYLAQVIAFAGNYFPIPWAQCDGQLLNIALDPALYRLIGTTYGGDGKESFALPNLQGAMIIGAAS